MMMILEFKDGEKEEEFFRYLDGPLLCWDLGRGHGIF